MFTTEHNLLKGARFDKFACVSRSPDYGEGDWANQFKMILPSELENKYDITTKAKFKNKD
jgi:hypothetical protein